MNESLYFCELSEHVQDDIINLITIRMSDDYYTLEEINETIENVKSERLKNIVHEHVESYLTREEVESIINGLQVYDLFVDMGSFLTVASDKDLMTIKSLVSDYWVNHFKNGIDLTEYARTNDIILNVLYEE